MPSRELVMPGMSLARYVLSRDEEILAISLLAMEDFFADEQDCAGAILYSSDRAVEVAMEAQQCLVSSHFRTSIQRTYHGKKAKLTARVATDTSTVGHSIFSHTWSPLTRQIIQLEDSSATRDCTLLEPVHKRFVGC